MKGTGPEGRTVGTAKTSGSQLLAETPSSRPPPVPSAAANRIVPKAPHPAAVIRALAPTVAEWMPTDAAAPTQDAARGGRPEPPVSDASPARHKPVMPAQ